MPRARVVPAGRARPYTVSSVENALTLLAALRDRPSLSVTEGAQLLGVAPSTAHRLLTTMASHGFVVQDPATRRYGAGPRLLEVALSSLERVDVRRVARPHLVALSAEIRETASLAVAEGSEVRFIDSVEGPELVRVASRTGDVLPAHLTAVGKAMLALLPVAEVLRAYPDEVIPGGPAATGAAGRPGGPARPGLTRAALLAQLDVVRRDGHASSFESNAIGLSAVAVAITDLHGNPLAAIGVSVPAARLDAHRVQEIAVAASRRVRRIEEELRGSSRTQVTAS